MSAKASSPSRVIGAPRPRAAPPPPPGSSPCRPARARTPPEDRLAHPRHPLGAIGGVGDEDAEDDDAGAHAQPPAGSRPCGGRSSRRTAARRSGSPRRPPSPARRRRSARSEPSARPRPRPRRSRPAPRAAPPAPRRVADDLHPRRRVVDEAVERIERQHRPRHPRRGRVDAQQPAERGLPRHRVGREVGVAEDQVVAVAHRAQRAEHLGVQQGTSPLSMNAVLPDAAGMLEHWREVRKWVPQLDGATCRSGFEEPRAKPINATRTARPPPTANAAARPKTLSMPASNGAESASALLAKVEKRANDSTRGRLAVRSE